MRARDRSVQVGRNGLMPPLSFPLHAAEATSSREAQAARRRGAESSDGRRGSRQQADRDARARGRRTPRGDRHRGSTRVRRRRRRAGSTGGSRGGRLHALCRRPRSSASLRHDAGRHVEGVEHDARRRAGRTTRCRRCGGRSTTPSTRHSSSTISSTAASRSSTGATSRSDRAGAEGLRPGERHAERFSRRIPPWAIGSRSARGSRRARRSRRRAPRTSRSAPTSTRRPLPRSSTPTSSRARSGSRPTRSYPAAPRRLPPGWRNWSDAVGLKPTVLRDIWVRVPAPAYVPQAGRMAQSIGQPGRVIAKLSVTSTYSR